ncbi:hypothetical protein BS50DRAFT_647471, partial [Corynespora cassiicola Philippines]
SNPHHQNARNTIRHYGLPRSTRSPQPPSLRQPHPQQRTPPRQRPRTLTTPTTQQQHSSNHHHHRRRARHRRGCGKRLQLPFRDHSCGGRGEGGHELVFLGRPFRRRSLHFRTSFAAAHIPPREGGTTASRSFLRGSGWGGGSGGGFGDAGREQAGRRGSREGFGDLSLGVGFRAAGRVDRCR